MKGYEIDSRFGFVPRRIGYTTAQARLKWWRSGLAQHRKTKHGWVGTKEAYQKQLDKMLDRVAHYKNLLLEPEYASKVREAKNRKRRKKRPPLRGVYTMVSCCITGNEVANEYLAHLPWMVARVKKKRFKTMRHLASTYRKPLGWVREAKAAAIKGGLITEVEWEQSFRRPGRPRKGKPRGPYKTKQKSKT